MFNRSEFFWNMIASIFASLLSVVLLFITTRVNGATDAGMFALVFASATVLYSIADFGMRVYQVTDTTRQQSFGEYLSSRILVDIIMVVCGFVFVLISGYTLEKALICMGLVAFRFVDGLSETYQGEFQLNGRLDIAGKSVFFRMVISLLVFALIDILTGNMLVSTYIMAGVNFMIFALYDLRLIGRYTKKRPIFDKVAVRKVLIACFPVFASTFLNNYIINAPKYAIDRFLEYDIQTYFNIIYLPTFTINLMSLFVLKPMLKGMGELWNDNERHKFLGVIGKMGIAIVIMTVLVEAVCFVAGIPVLSWIYGVDLAAYKRDLLILVLSGGFSALSVGLFYTLTTMRVQGKAMISYVIAAGCGLILPRYFVRNYGITGAAISSVLIMMVLAVVLFIFFIYAWRHNKRISQV